MEGAESHANGGRADEALDGHDPTDDEGPSGQPPDPAPPPGARRRRVAFDAVRIGENLAETEVTIPRQTKFLAVPARGGPDVEQIMTRTTQNLDTGKYYEKNAVVVGKSVELNEVDVHDEVCGNAVLRRAQNESTNPGVHPDRWFKTSVSERKRLIE
eukprot:5578038-Pyramimonas_sp.AAC.1